LEDIPDLQNAFMKAPIQLQLKTCEEIE